jgi:hypothetical protein
MMVFIFPKILARPGLNHRFLVNREKRYFLLLLKWMDPLKLVSPHFVDFGKNMEHSPDGKTYLVGHGSTEKDEEERRANLSWITGNEINLCRVVPTPENINNEDAYEYFAGHDTNGNAVWSDDYTDIKPLIEWDNNMGCVTITYNAPLKKYLMCVTDGWLGIKMMNTYILESDSITGPWRIMNYWKEFGPQAYFVNIPTKFSSDDGKRFWLSYSANYYQNRENRNNAAYLKSTTPPGRAYSFSLHEVEWKNSDFENQLITIVAKKESRELLVWDPKSRRNRIVPMADESAQLLADLQLKAKEGFPYIFISPQRLKRIRERQKIGTWTPRSQIINNLDRDSRILQCKAGIDKCVIHDLRRSAITNWAKKLPIQVVQELAGQSDISTTRKYYLAVRSEDLASANKLLNQILAKVRTN